MTTKETGGPAFPCERDHGPKLESSEGMTLRQYAAIKLKVPDSGIDWLDEMITKSLCDDFAAKAMHQMLHGAVLPVGYDATGDLRLLVERAYQVADAMMEARK